MAFGPLRLNILYSESSQMAVCLCCSCLCVLLGLNAEKLESCLSYQPKSSRWDGIVIQIYAW